ncbi:MAG TPA: hypothetical protein DDZ88_18870 [Verrucomicrobiales bacterium]|nr:hypothetical protein [Verrucomicrobiales bacterium]
MHPEIDRGLTKDWLTRISKAMGETPPSVWYTDQVAFIMSLDKLRAELIKLFEHYKLNPFLFDSLTNWHALLRRLFEHLVDTPLRRSDHIPPDSAHRFWITKLQITLENPGSQQPASNSNQTGKFSLVMDFLYDDVNGLYPNTQRNGEKCQAIMPLVVPEKPEAFKFP